MSPATTDRSHQVAEQLFERNAAVFGDDLPTYRGHVHRVIGLVGLQRDIDPAAADAVGLAAFFHDAGIWFDDTWDYLPPSVGRAVAELGGPDQPKADLVEALIGEHHRLRRARHADPLVEAFRRADLTDVSGGLIGVPGAPRGGYRELVAQYPARGFRPMLLRAFGHGLRESPLRPMPMMKI